MRVSFECQHCRALLEVEASSEMFGQQVACPHCQATLTVPDKTLGPGVTLGGYLIQRELGRGAMGQVFLATQLSLGRAVALKTLPPEFAFQRALVERFLQEMRLAARLAHRHIVTIYESGVDNGVYYFSMEFVDGVNLDEHVARHGPLPEPRALAIARKVATALRYAWENHQLLHRDIKPANILLDQAGEPKLTDLGLAKCLDRLPSLTMTSAIMGTPNYMSPEQTQNTRDVDYRADMYSLGATLYHVLTGQAPFAGGSIPDILRKQATESLPHPQRYNTKISTPCTALLEIMLAKDPARRHQSWHELIHDIERALAGRFPAPREQPTGGETLIKVSPRVTPSPAPSAAAHSAPATRAQELAVGGAITVAVAILLGLVIWFGRQPPAVVEPPAAPEPAAVVELPPVVAETFLAPGGLFDEPPTPPVPAEPPAVVADLVAQLERQGAALAALRTTTEELVADHDYAGALRAVRDYDGPDAALWAAERAALAAALEAQWLAREWARLPDMLAGMLLRQEFLAATNQLTLVAGRVPVIAAHADWEPLRALVEQVVRLPQIIEDSFRAQIDSEVRLMLNDAELTLRILGVAGGTVAAETVWRVNGEEVGSVSRDFQLTELRSQERFQRLGVEATPDRDIMRGILAWEAREYAAATRFLERSGTALGAAMNAQVRTHVREQQAQLEARRKAARETAAALAFEELLRVAGMTSAEAADPARLADTFAERRFTATQVEKLQREAPRAQTAFGDTEFVRQRFDVFVVIEQLRAGIPLRVTAAELALFLDRLQRANPTAREPELVAEPGGLALSLANDLGVEDLRPLSGMPITKLDLTGTKARDLAPLRELPLVELLLSGVTQPELRPLAGLTTLRRLALDRCGRLDLAPLAGLSLEWLDLSGASIVSLGPLRRMPLRTLRLIDTRVDPADVRALVAAVRRQHGLELEIVRGDWRMGEPDERMRLD